MKAVGGVGNRMERLAVFAVFCSNYQPSSSGIHRIEPPTQGDPVAGDRISLSAQQTTVPRIDPWRDQLEGLLLENQGNRYVSG
jgi:hypothetical protein